MDKKIWPSSPLVSDLDDYQRQTIRHRAYPAAHALTYTSLGLAGEAGEVANQVKKVIRDDNCEMTPARRGVIIDELGDVLWYAAALAAELGVTLTHVANTNLGKLDTRKQRMLDEQSASGG